MKQLTFHRESNNFDDILNDSELKKYIGTTIFWHHGLLIQIPDSETKLLSYIELKYGESIIKLSKDRTPIPFVHYLPKKPEPSADTD